MASLQGEVAHAWCLRHFSPGPALAPKVFTQGPGLQSDWEDRDSSEAGSIEKAHCVFTLI